MPASRSVARAPRASHCLNEVGPRSDLDWRCWKIFALPRPRLNSSLKQPSSRSYLEPNCFDCTFLLFCFTLVCVCTAPFFFPLLLRPKLWFCFVKISGWEFFRLPAYTIRDFCSLIRFSGLRKNKSYLVIITFSLFTRILKLTKSKLKAIEGKKKINWE